MKPETTTYVLTVTMKGVKKREAKTLAKFTRDMTKLMRQDQAIEMRPSMEVTIATAHVKDVK